MTGAMEILELTDDFYQDPHATYRALRARGPLHRIRSNGVLGWLVVDHEVAKQALTEPTISKRVGSPEGQAVLAKNGAAELFNTAISDNMLFADPPQHTRLRRLVAKAFSGPAIRDLQPRITAIADTLLDDIGARTTVDLMDSYAFQLPTAVICEVLGVPDSDKEEFRAWTAVVVSDSATIEERTAAGISYLTYLSKLIAERTADPRDDILSQLIIAKDHDDRLDEHELIAMLLLLLIAGHETTVNLIGNSVLELLRDPATAERLRTHPDAIPAYLEEILRCHGSLHVATARYTTAPITLGGTDIDAGEFILISLAAANRDPARFTDPDRIDLERPESRHIAFGHGIHHCLGATLARVEATTAISRLLARFPEISLDGEFSDLTWRKSLLIHGLTSLPVRPGAPTESHPASNDDADRRALLV
ncbi:cytochrome P450 [Nocardia sp. NPDC050697]|uniref:cytochrome P450 family protein n=1 Tax=Nocardia sp. NPDC050697 TaxID=3155158 RepID=UPI0033F94051